MNDTHSRWQWLKRYPYASAFVVGIVLVTLSVPFFRRVPRAPAPIGTMPAWTFQDAAGHDVASTSLGGRTYLFVLTSATCEGSCARVGRDLALMQGLLAKVKADASIVSVDIGGGGAALGSYLTRSGGQPEGWLALGGSPESACAVARASFAKVRRIELPCERLHDLTDDPHALIVDGQGSIRACIRLDREGLDEAFHRMLAVVENRPVEQAP